MKKKIDWEERRWITASLILAGCSANYHNGLSGINRVEDAILIADSLIKKLADPTRPSMCSKLYNKPQKPSNLSK